MRSLLALGLFLPSLAFAQEVKSNFPAGDQNWSLETASAATSPDWVNVGGQNGSYITNTCTSVDNQAMWVAPAAYRGDQSDKLDGKFTLWRNNSKVSQPYQVFIELTGANGDTVYMYRYNYAATDGNGWFKFIFALKANNFTRGSYQPAVTRADLKDILTDVADLRIQAYGCDGIDTVRLTPPP